MRFPEIPTDNLYKFMALSGVAILVLSLTPFYHAHRLYLESLRLSGDIRILGIQIEWQSMDMDQVLQQTNTLKQETGTLAQQTGTLKKQVDELRETTPSETAADLDTKRRLGEVRKETANKVEDIEKELDTLIESRLQLEESQHRLEESQRKQEVTLIQHKTKIEEHRYLARLIGVELLLGGLGSLSGVVLATKGFRLWHLKLQVHQDRIIQMKAKAEDAQHNGDAHPS
jgi:hypothetical protein